MKNKIIKVLLLVSILLVNFSEIVYAQNANSLNQIVEVGGTNSTNTDNKQDGVTVSKTIEKTNIENYFDITLGVTTTSKTEEIINSQNLAIVFVIDRSYTMGSNSRWTNAVKGVIDLSKSLSKLSGVKMAAVGFSGGDASSNEAKWNDTVDLRPAFSSAVFTEEELGNYDTDNQRGGGTNMHGGLLRAYELLEPLPKTMHKKIILLSDGVPTYYYDANGYTKGPGNSDTKDKMKEVPDCQKAAVDYAKELKDKNIDIYTIGYELDALTYKPTINGKVYNEKQIAIDTLTNIASNANQFYRADSKDAISQVFSSILQKIKEYIATTIDVTWVVKDPMGIDDKIKNIEFVGLYNDLGELKDELKKGNANESNSAQFKDNKISWDLKNSQPTTTESGNVVTSHYELKYRIRLQNELDSFVEGSVYDANETTVLTYAVVNNGTTSSLKNIEFPIPKIKGFLGSLTFTKKSSFDGSGLSGAKFKLSHDPDCTCHNERKHAQEEDLTLIAESNAEGIVAFDKIPSGHKYILSETTAPQDYQKSNQEIKIEVRYGETIGGPENNVFLNEIKKANLKISKEVIGQVESNKEFSFTLEVKYNNKKIDGEYNYKINGTKEGTINLANATFKLGNNDNITIYNLPVGATYEIIENSNKGFDVEYQINSSTKVKGIKATCKDNCRLEEGTSNTVKYINTKAFILPSTGSSNKLIMEIIAFLFIGGPIIYMSNSLYKRRRNA